MMLDPLRHLLPALALGMLLPCNPAMASDAALGQSTFRFDQPWHDWLPFESWHGLMVMTVSVDGQPVRAVLDTGASRSMKFAQTTSGGSALDVNAVGGKAAGVKGTIHQFSMGPIQAIDMPIVLIAPDAIGTPPFDMVIGLDLLGSYTLQVDWSQHRLRFGLSGDSRTDGVVLPIAMQEKPEGLAITTSVTICGRAPCPPISTAGPTRL